MMRFRQPFGRGGGVLPASERSGGEEQPDRPSGAADRAGRRGLRLLGLAAVLALAGYLVVMALQMGACAGGSDTSGYANSARLLVEGHLQLAQRRIEGTPAGLSDFTYVPLGFVPAGAGGLAPTYPLGLPALFVAGSWLVGSLETAMPVVMWLMLAGGLAGTFVLGRQMGLSRGWAWLAAGMLAVCPLYVGMSLMAMSDVPALCWTTWALVLAWASRKRRWAAVPAGFAVAVAVFVRPSSALVLVPLGWAFGLDWRRWLGLGLGGMPGAVVWLGLNRVMFGRWVTSGYGAVGGLFGWEHVPAALHQYAITLPWLLPLGWAALFLCWRRDRSPRLPRGGAALLVSWPLVGLVFYAFYKHTAEAWWFLRFILPMLPALAILGAAGLRRTLATALTERAAVRRNLGVAVVVVLVAAGAAVEIRACFRTHVFYRGRSELQYGELIRLAQTKMPANAVVFCMQTSGALTFYEPQRIVVRYDCIEAEHVRQLYAAAARAGRPVYALLFPFDRIQYRCFERSLVGRWTQVGALRDKTIWRLDDPEGTMPADPTP